MDKEIEEKIIKLLENGEALQSRIYRALNVSKSRVSEVLSELEEKKVIRREKIGRNYLVYLNSYSKVSGNYIKLGIIRSSEYGYVIPLKKKLAERGYTLEIKVYDNGLDVMKDLSAGRIHFGISPAISQIFFSYLDFPIKIIAPAGSGGGYLFSRPSTEKPKALSSKLSTMELILLTAVNSSVIRNPLAVSYFRDPSSAVNEFLREKAEAITVWEPYASVLRGQGYSESFSYEEVEHYCCTVSAHRSLSDELIEVFRKELIESIKDYEKNRSGYAQPYAALLGLPGGLVEESLKRYSYHDELDLNLLEKQLYLAGIRVPSPTSLKKIIEA